MCSTVGGGGCSVPWGGVLSTVGVFSTVGDIMSTVGGYLEYRGGCSVPWGTIQQSNRTEKTIKGPQKRPISQLNQNDFTKQRDPKILITGV